MEEDRQLTYSGVSMFMCVFSVASSVFEAMKSVAGELGFSEESGRRWPSKSQVDAGERPGTTRSEHAETRKLRLENAELRRANEHYTYTYTSHNNVHTCTCACTCVHRTVEQRTPAALLQCASRS